jgi:hypothetical protein
MALRPIHSQPTYPFPCPRALLNFQHNGHAWTVYFVEADCRTGIGSRTRYSNFPSLDGLRSFVTSCQPEEATLAGFDYSVRAWGRSNEYVRLTPEQYGKVTSM